MGALAPLGAFKSSPPVGACAGKDLMQHDTQTPQINTHIMLYTFQVFQDLWRSIAWREAHVP